MADSLFDSIKWFFMNTMWRRWRKFGVRKSCFHEYLNETNSGTGNNRVTGDGEQEITLRFNMSMDDFTISRDYEVITEATKSWHWRSIQRSAANDYTYLHRLLVALKKCPDLWMHEMPMPEHLRSMGSQITSLIVETTKRIHDDTTELLKTHRTRFQWQASRHLDHVKQYDEDLHGTDYSVVETAANRRRLVFFYITGWKKNISTPALHCMKRPSATGKLKYIVD